MFSTFVDAWKDFLQKPSIVGMLTFVFLSERDHLGGSPIGGCTAVDVDILTSRRAEPDRFEVEVGAEKVRDGSGNHLADITVTFRIAFPAGEGGDKARAILPDAVRQSHERYCTVSRTVELGTPITTHIE